MNLSSPPGTPHSIHSFHGELTPSSSAFMKTQSYPHKTVGELLSSLVGASLTTVDNLIYVLGGFDRYSDEVFNTLYKLTIDDNMQGQGQQQHYNWTRVQYNTDTVVMAKRNDHTATLWGKDKLVVFGGTGEEEEYFNNVSILHLKTMTWEHPITSGFIPHEGRIKHSATIYHNKLYIAGGLERHDRFADSVLILDLQTYEWLPPIPFVKRSQHMTYFYNKRLYLFGGYHENMSRSNVLTFLDLDTHVITQLEIGSSSAPPLIGQQFVQICGDQLIVVMTELLPVIDREDTFIDDDDDDNNNNNMNRVTGLWNLDLSSMQWQHHDIQLQFEGCYWQHFAMAEHGDSFLLFGATNDDLDEYYTMVLRIQLKEHGIVPVPPSQLGTDLAGLLTVGQSSADFIIRSSLPPPSSSSSSIDHGKRKQQQQDLHVHRLVLLARWPHFAHLMQSGMVESLNDCMSLPEPFDSLKAFIQFLYTDTLDESLSPLLVADLMVMANLYLLPRLLALCVRRLYNCITINYASKIYLASVNAGQDGLQQASLNYIFHHFGEVVKTETFRSLPTNIMNRLLDEIPFFLP
ncbi:unnamed protein product [Cunninghamella echinulata]